MTVTVAGMVILVSLGQVSNTPFAMLVMPFGMVTLARLVPVSNA